MGERSILITGGAGFVGQTLASALPADPNTKNLRLTDVFQPPVPQARHLTPTSFTALSDAEQNSLSPGIVHGTAADLTDRDSITQELFSDSAPVYDVVYILHGIMSAASEADLDLSLRVNVDATRNILDALRHSPRYKGKKVKVVYTSSCAVYGAQDRASPARFLSMTFPAGASLMRGSYACQRSSCERASLRGLRVASAVVCSGSRSRG